MSKYTGTIRWIVEQAEKDEWGKYDEGVYTEASYKKLGLMDYPIFDESYRHLLNDKIINNYYFNEIGAETVGQFRWFMKNRMALIMPYYNQLYESENLIENPLKDKDMEYKELWNDHSNTETTSNVDYDGTTNSNANNIFSDTPMGMLGNDGSPSIENGDYATTASYDKSNTTANNSTTSNGTNDNTRGGDKISTETGRTRSESDLLKEWRSTFLNIDMEIIEKLNDLFMGLW